MAALVLAGIYVVKRTIDKCERRKSVKESRAQRYAELQRETEARVAGYEEQPKQSAVTDSSGATVSTGPGHDRIPERDSFAEERSSSESLRAEAERQSSAYGSTEGAGSRRQSLFGSSSAGTDGRRPSLFGNKRRRSNMMGTYDR